jgi:regulator of sirC expression with transglutaminase-like and TPR domain
LLDTKTKIQYLFKLLDDDSSEIQKILRNSFLENAQELILKKPFYLLQVSKELRPLLQQKYQELHFDLVKAAFQQLLSHHLEDIDLEKSVMILSYWNNPDVDIPALQHRLDRMAEEIHAHMPFTGHPLAFLDHINYYLFKKYGFHGNSTDYYNPDNNFIDRVLETRSGIPISLSVLYILIARRMGIPILGVPMPAHFIIKFDNGTDEVFCDPFYKGKIYTRKECLAYLNNANVIDPLAILRGTTDYQIVFRMMRNIKLVYSSYKEDRRKVEEIQELLEQLGQFYL